MKKEGQNPDDALTWVRSEMADDAGVDIEDFMTDFDWGDFPGKAEGGRIGMVGGGLAKGARWFINSITKNFNRPCVQVIQDLIRYPQKKRKCSKKGIKE